MKNCTVALSANAGISLTLGQQRIWIDAVHRRKTPGYSTVTESLWAQMKRHEAFVSPDLIFFTHRHPDHYSRTLTQEALALWPEASLVMPGQEFERQICLSAAGLRMGNGAHSLHFFALPHEGAQYADVANYGMIACSDEFRVLIAGDCALASPVLAQRLSGIKIDLAILDFPWLSLPRGREFIETYIAPRHLMLCHLPFDRDDRFGYRIATEKAAARFHPAPDVRLLEEPLQVETI